MLINLQNPQMKTTTLIITRIEITAFKPVRQGSEKKAKDHGLDYDPCHGPTHVY